MKLKTWQKWGISFGLVHIVAYPIVLFLTRYGSGCNSSIWILLYIHSPYYYFGIGKTWFGGLLYRNILGYFILLLTATLSYVLIGAFLGFIIQSFGGKSIILEKKQI